MPTNYTAMSEPLRYYVPHMIALAFGATAAAGAALIVKERVETQALTDIGLVLSQSGQDWVDVQVDGLRVTLTGTAPDEATRFAALSTAGGVVDATRIIDSMDVQAAEAIQAPDFSIEILKNTDGMSLIGLVPSESDPETILERARRVAGTAQITNLIESAEFAPPEGWERALAFGLSTLDILPRAKVSITPSRVTVTAVAATPEEKRQIEADLNRDAPAGVALSLAISAPRPVIAPFTLRFVISENGARFDACSADTEDARDRILGTAIAAGLAGDTSCTLGLGVPSTQWADAAVESIATLAAIGQGSVTLSNADITLVAAVGTEPDRFEREIGALEGRLPDVFSLSATLTPSEEATESDGTAPEFIATRSPEGDVQLRGRMGDALSRDAVEAFAAAHFGMDKVTPATRLDANVPPRWSMRVLTALEALALLNNGRVYVAADRLEISGLSGRRNARAEVSRLFGSKLGDDVSYEIDVSYVEELDPLAALPTPEECVAAINEAAGKQKITFEPGSTDISADAIPTIDAIAELLRDCQTVRIEIGGHTDSQGRESMNQQLSQSRADAVLNAIMSRRVLTSNLSARGYGESEPIADNGTEDGREANRRIEFKLILPGEAQGPEAPDEPTDDEEATE